LSPHDKHETLLRLEAAGFDHRAAERIIRSEGNALAIKMVALAKNGSFEPTTSQQSARKIMGNNFFGVEELVRHFEIGPSKEQLLALAEVPFTLAELEESRYTHYLMASLPFSVIDIRAKADARLFYKKGLRYEDQTFATDKGKTGWHLVRMTAVAGSTSQSWPKQQAILPQNERTPSFRVMVGTIIGYHLTAGGRLFKDTCVRTSSVDSSGKKHIYVGRFDDSGLRVYSAEDDFSSQGIGIGAELIPSAKP